MLLKQGNRIVYDSSRCTRCGTCLAVCKSGALRLEEGEDVFGIVVNHEACVGCQKCVRVCPASDLPKHRMEESDFTTLRRAFLAHATDADLRYKSTSGGVARTLARAALETGWVDAVYCVVQKNDPPYAEGAFLTSSADLDRISNSVYCALPVNENLRKEINGKPLSRLLYIGTNCQIQAAERLYKGSGVELIKVAIICKQQKTRAYVRWSRRMMKQSPRDETPIRYRGNGWPGQITSGQGSYKNFFRPFAMQLWRVPGCRFCPNAFGWGSDILLADPWNLISINSSNPGLTMTLLRTDTALSLWKVAAPYLTEERELTAAEVRKSIEWEGYKKNKQGKIPFYLGNEPSLIRRLGYGLLEKQRTFYEWLFDVLAVPEVVEKILNRTLKK